MPSAWSSTPSRLPVTQLLSNPATARLRPACITCRGASFQAVLCHSSRSEACALFPTADLQFRVCPSANVLSPVKSSLTVGPLAGPFALTS